ncbi:MAG: hypothetical protein WBF06_01795 [Candidatus Acidiferrales bacterium]
MSTSPQPIFCDGCGLAASPTHIRERLARLEVATRYRPIHISVLFVDVSPDAGLDFYDVSSRPAGAREILLDALGIAVPSETSGASHASAIELRLTEFQRRGFFFASVSECPLAIVSAAQIIDRLGSTLLKRVQFSYRPKSVVLLSGALSPLVPMLARAGQGIRVIPDGAPIAWPRPGDSAGELAFRAACARIAETART